MTNTPTEPPEETPSPTPSPEEPPLSEAEEMRFLKDRFPTLYKVGHAIAIVLRTVGPIILRVLPYVMSAAPRAARGFAQALRLFSRR